MKIGILYIAIGKYSVFWKEFYLSCEKYFLKNFEKFYYVFTDCEELFGKDKNLNIITINQEDLGWPNNTLLRFDMFYSIQDDLKKMDYLFFFNANLLLLQEIGEEFLPKSENLLVVLHPAYYKEQNADFFPYSRNKNSKAYIPYGQGKYYVQGALNGGKAKEFLKLIYSLSVDTKEDLKKGIIAEVHDESHLNKYILNRTDLKILGPEYLYPENWKLGIEPIILSREKSKYFDVDKLKKNRLKYLGNKLKQKIKQLIAYILRRE